MSRYVTRARRPRSGDDDWYQVTPPLGHPTVFVPEPADTGLVDADGNPIFKVPDPMGFLSE